nr:hypothetical protein [uncultured Sphingomonas sp.]
MGMPLPWLGTAYSFFKDLRGWSRRRFHLLAPEERLVRREKWKERFREEIWSTEEKELRQDVIVRDVRRLDQYPDSPDHKGISPWFRVALVGQYHRGIELGLSIHSLIFEKDGGWRLAADYEREGVVRAHLLGFVRYEDIELVDWFGDEYYNYPHIYCHFTKRGTPYEKLAFCECKSIHPKHYFYTELASYGDVKLTSEKYGTDHLYWRQY